MRWILGALLAVGCTKPADECLLSGLLPDLAGPGAQDCGTVPVGGDRAAVDACTVAAFQAGTPFFAVFELLGIDSQVSEALVSDGSVVKSLLRDSDPSGGSGIGAVVTEHLCNEPSVIAGDEGHDVVDCPLGGDSCAICGGDGADCLD